MIIKVIILCIILLLAWAFLAAPVAQAGRWTADYFKSIWENTDENTDIQD